MQLEEQKSRAGKGALSGILGGTISLTISTIIVKVLGLIYKIPLASLLGDEGMGYFNSAYTVYAFFYLLCTAGVPKAVMILISEAKALGKGDYEQRILKIASLLFLSLGIVITAVFILFSKPLAVLIGNSRSAFTMVAIAPSIIFISLSGVIRGLLSANMRLLDIAVSQIIEGISKLVLGLLFAILAIRLNLPLSMASALTILGVTFGAMFGLLYLFVCSKNVISREKAGQSTKIDKCSLIIKRIFSISIPITLSSAVMSITNIIDLGLIMRGLKEAGYSETAANALYGNYTTLAVPMFNLAVAIITPISVAYLPVFTRARVVEDKELFIKGQKSALELTTLVGAPLMIGMMVYSKEILSLLFGNSETEIGAVLLCLLAPAIFFSSLLIILNTSLEALGLVRAPVISMLIGSIAKIGVSYFLLRNPSLGISGAPIGTVVSYAVALMVSLIIYSAKFNMHFAFISPSIKAYLNAFFAVMISNFIYYRMINSIDERASLILSVAVAAVIYIAFSIFTGVLKKEKMLELAKYTNFT